MSEYLYRVFHENETGLVQDVTRELKSSTSPHYLDIDTSVLYQRVETLVAYFLLSLKDTPEQFVKYVSQMAEERIAEGFTINETLMALRVLEERAWLLVTQFVPQQGIVPSLSRVTGTVGAAKDQLAHVYVEHLERSSGNPNGL